MKNLKKYSRFWLGVIISIFLIGIGVEHGYWAFIVLGAYFTGFFIKPLKTKL